MAARACLTLVNSYLLRHKASVAQRYISTRNSQLQTNFSDTKDEKADLIVAGGYGHRRLGEWIFGGVTHDLLADSPVCCLFSH